ncbi:MAG: nickel pincer cofactor biosynthesis protein LarB [Nitrospirae bacterium]|nr:nickel pincer cofactor biosynthesis protein LarB [Nitrospirota bacterium]MBF0536304.1 nickel pincer cofactor biosynthesis protein LarB [Nitrospirota bacterium]MBF0618245.1 nickel pincer cofactor biosynthesis protein LarB [Nitrospirota bacterium]
MDTESLKSLLNSFKTGIASLDDVLKTLKHMPYEDLEFARIDHHRALISGMAEVVFGQNKKTEDSIAIAHKIYKENGKVLLTRVNEDVYNGLNIEGAAYDKDARVITASVKNIEQTGKVLIISAGTADIPVAKEAALTASFLGSAVETLFDAGVAGLHRILKNMRLFDSANAIVVIAGMEGALPSVVGALTDKPIIAVPTSVGYGTSLGGLTALFAMLNSCVPGIAVMNIDNGFGAGCFAHKINMLSVR